MEQLYEYLHAKTPTIDLQEAQTQFTNLLVDSDPVPASIAASDAVSVIDDVSCLEILATKTYGYALCAIEKLSDQGQLVSIALHCRSAEAREVVLRKLNPSSLQAIIEETERSGSMKDVEEKALRLKSGYVCVSCHASNLPDENGCPPCFCRSCGFEQHDYVAKRARQRLYRDEALIREWDECIRCGAQINEESFTVDD